MRTENLLTATLQELAQATLTPADITFIGAATGECCSWEDFMLLADRAYDCGWGPTQVATDLVIRFRSGAWLERWEYDGSEGWSFKTPWTPPAHPLPLRAVFVIDGTVAQAQQGL